VSQFAFVRNFSVGLSNLVAENVGIEPNTVLSDIGLDSFSTIEMVLFLERKFGIELPDEVLTPDNIASVSALTACAISFTENK